MNSAADRTLAPVFRRLDNIVARGVLRGTVDEKGVQTMQASLLEGETADELDRVQTYGISSHPPTGGDAVILFVQGNRDDGIVISVNDRESRPKDLKAGEVILYNDKGVSVLLNEEGDLVVKAERHITVEAKEDITIKAKTITLEGEDKITIKAPEVEI